MPKGFIIHPTVLRSLFHEQSRLINLQRPHQSCPSIPPTLPLRKSRFAIPQDRSMREFWRLQWLGHGQSPIIDSQRYGHL